MRRQDIIPGRIYATADFHKTPIAAISTTARVSPDGDHWKAATKGEIELQKFRGRYNPPTAQFPIVRIYAEITPEVITRVAAITIEEFCSARRIGGRIPLGENPDNCYALVSWVPDFRLFDMSWEDYQEFSAKRRARAQEEARAIRREEEESAAALRKIVALLAEAGCMNPLDPSSQDAGATHLLYRLTSGETIRIVPKNNGGRNADIKVQVLLEILTTLYRAAPPVVSPEAGVAAALTDEQRKYLIARWNETNPHLAGAQAADILELLTSGDSDLEIVEPFLEEYPDVTDPRVPCILRALIWSGTDVTIENVRELLSRMGA